MTARLLRQTTAVTLAAVCLTGCAARSPYAVDPPLREAANRFAVALGSSDRGSLSQMAATDGGAMSSLVALYGGRSIGPLAYDSRDRGIADVEFTVSCDSGTATFWERFVYVSGIWKPDLSAHQPQAGSIPPTSVPPSLFPSPTPQPSCG